MFHVFGAIEVAFDCCLVVFVKRIGPNFDVCLLCILLNRMCLATTIKLFFWLFTWFYNYIYSFVDFIKYER